MLLKKLAPYTHHILKSRYATITSDHWPRPTSRNRHPTPYQILDIDPKAPYSKLRFNELVKIYHPDRKDHAVSHICAHLRESERLERYRIIVSAHSLLSDPIKREAYDKHGIGWLDGFEDTLLQRAAAAGGKDAHGTARNATWEDWERWREAREQEGYYGKERPQPYYMSNRAFAGMLILFTLGAAQAQTMHAQSMTEARRLIREENHYKATRDYENKQAAARKSNREQRIEDFVRQKDPAVLGNQTLSGLVMNPDLCESGDDKGRSKELDMKRRFK